LGVERRFGFARLAAAAQDEMEPAPKLELGSRIAMIAPKGCEALPSSTEASRFPLAPATFGTSKGETR
jgi:hypothetical protein